LLTLAAVVAVRADDATPDTPGLPQMDGLHAVGMTSPSRTATLAAVMHARIARIEAKEGTSVAEGDLVVALADGVQAARTEIARAGAESTYDIELAAARREHAQREWERLSKLHGDDHASSKELNDARTDARTTQLEHQLALFAHEQAARTHERERRILEEYRLRAPFSGYVVRHLKHEGETVDQLEGIVQLVQLDPLHVDLDCPIALAPLVRIGDRPWIRPTDPHWTPRLGTVVLASRVMDAGSQTFRVRLKVPNGDQAWPAGLKVIVDFGTSPRPDERRAADQTRNKPRDHASARRRANGRADN
jgi:RND family efflux transporter MFP subunit